MILLTQTNQLETQNYLIQNLHLYLHHLNHHPFFRERYCFTHFACIHLIHFGYWRNLYFLQLLGASFINNFMLCEHSYKLQWYMCILQASIYKMPLKFRS